MPIDGGVPNLSTAVVLDAPGPNELPLERSAELIDRSLGKSYFSERAHATPIALVLSGEARIGRFWIPLFVQRERTTSIRSEPTRKH